MDSRNKSSDILLFDKKIGLITTSEVILEEKNKQVKIDLNTINKVSLSKHRVYFGNALLFLLSLVIILNTQVFFRNHPAKIYYSLLSIAIVVLFFAFFHKFYFYKIDFKKKKEVVYTYQTTQLKRNSIKTFYNCLKNVLKENVTTK